jgi:hypothetical protein
LVETHNSTEDTDKAEGEEEPDRKSISLSKLIDSMKKLKEVEGEGEEREMFFELVTLWQILGGSLSFMDNVHSIRQYLPATVFYQFLQSNK